MERIVDFNIEGDTLQKNTICKIIIQYGYEIIIFPVNPEELRIEGNNMNKRDEVLGLGEINILRDIGLKTIKFTSFLPFRWTTHPYIQTPKAMWRPISYYINLFNRIRKNKLPCRIIIPSMLINTQVSIETFNHWEEFGDEDRWFDIELLEWKDYAPLEFTLESNGVITKIPYRTPEPDKFPLLSKINIKGILYKTFPALASGVSLASNSTPQVNATGTAVENVVGVIKLKDPLSDLYYIYDSEGKKALGWVHETSLTGGN